MGITGLLKSLESISQKKHLSDYRGKRIAVDGYCWLHKAIYMIKSEVIENPTSTKYMQYLIRRLDSLVQNQISPVIVFDGDRLPMKKLEEDERKKKREETQKYAMELFNKGLENQARQKLIESIDIDPKMAYNFIKELKRRNIEFFVAPYEADAQLAYLAKINYVDLVITEDSDLVALGCQKVLFKLNLETGFGFEIDLTDLPKCKDVDFTLFNHDKFLYYCILSGCDYFKLRGVGIKTAYQAVKERNSYKDCLQLLRLSTKNIPADCEDEFEKAFLTFKFQVVYCPIEKKMRHYEDMEQTIYTFVDKFQDKSFLGKIYDDEITKKIVFGQIDPISHQSFEETQTDIVRKLFGLKKERNDLEQEKSFFNRKAEDKGNFLKPKNDYRKINSEEIEQIETFIDYDFEMDNKSDDKNKNSEDSSEKVNKPDYIQTIAMNLSQSNPKIPDNVFAKRKNPYSQYQMQKPNEEFDRQTKKFKFQHKENQHSLHNNGTYAKDSEDFYNEIIAVKQSNSSDYDINNNPIEKEDSVKSNDTDKALNYIDLFASYEYAKDTITSSRGDKKKLEKIHFETKQNKIVVSKPFEIKISEDSMFSKSTMINSDISQQNQNKNSNNISVQFSLDEYSFDKNEEYLKKDFIKPSYKANAKMCSKSEFI